MVTCEKLEKLSNRKKYLFACHCCREIWHLLKDERSKSVVALVELHVEQPVTKAELRAAAYAAADAAADAANAADAADAADAAADAADAAYDAAAYAAYAANAAAYAADAADAAANAADAADAAAYAAADAAANAADAAYAAANAAYAAARQQMQQLQEDIYYDLLMPDATFDHTPQAHTLMLAKAIYADNDWESLPVLADALEDEGFDNPTYLHHLRNGRRHWRGCWALDMLLGKE